MIGKGDEFWGGFEKPTTLKLRWRQAADCSRGGIRQPEMHDHQQWTAVYFGSLAARMTTAGDGDSWKQRRSGCSRKDTVAPGRAGIGRWAQLTWNRGVPETADSVGLAALVRRAHTEKIGCTWWTFVWAIRPRCDYWLQLGLYCCGIPILVNLDKSPEVDKWFSISFVCIHVDPLSVTVHAQHYNGWFTDLILLF